MAVTPFSRAVRIFLLLTFLFTFTVSLLPPAAEYDWAVFAGVPTWVLVFFYLTLIFGAALLARLSLNYNPRQYYVVCIGMLVAFFGLFYIPFSRGYFLNAGYNSDTLHHLGVVKDILKTGDIQTLTYPATHNFITTLHLLTGIQLNHLPWLISFTFFTLFIIAIAVCARTLSGDRKLTVLITLASFTVLFADYRYAVMPWIYAVPFIFFLSIIAKHYLTSNRNASFILFAVISLTLTVYHPFTAIYGGIFLFSYLLVSTEDEGTTITVENGHILPLTFGITIFTYHVFLETITGSLAGAFSTFLTASSAGPGAESASQASAFDYTIYQFLSRFILPIWGDILYYLLVGGIVAVFILLGWFRNNGSTLPFMRFLASQYVLGGWIGSVLLFTGFFGVSIRRVSQYVILISILLVGAGLYKISTALQSPFDKRRPAVVIGVLLILIAPVMIGSAATMYSPDQHITHKAATGSEWQFENTDLTRPYIADPLGRISRFHLGVSETRQLERNGYHLQPIRSHPNRLGYAESQNISTSLGMNETVYMVTKTRDRNWYRWEPEWRWQDVQFYTDTNYDQLQDDPTAGRVYSNGGFDIWMVDSI